MNLELTIEELLEPLRSVISVIEKKQTLPILSHVLIEIKNKKLNLITTNTEIEIKRYLPTTITKDITFTIYAKSLIDIISSHEATTIINFNIEKSKIIISIKNSIFNLNTLDSINFPYLPIIKDDNIKIKSLILKELIQNTSFSMGNKDIRPHLNGLYFKISKNYIIAVATDGHRLAIGEIKQTNNLKNEKIMILPKKSVFELSKLLEKNKSEDINIQITDNYFHLSNNDTAITSRLIDSSKFPDYNKVIPYDHENIIIINKNDFLNSLEQASIFVNERNVVNLVFKDSQLYIFTSSEKGGSEIKIAIKKFNKEIKISFNINYLIIILRKIQETQIKMILSYDNSTSCLITGIKDKIYKYILMPIVN